MTDYISKHHYWWPRKVYPSKRHRARHIYLKRSVHTAYHLHALKFCREPKARECHAQWCRYEAICCYCRSDQRL